VAADRGPLDRGGLAERPTALHLSGPAHSAQGMLRDGSPDDRRLPPGARRGPRPAQRDDPKDVRGGSVLSRAADVRVPARGPGGAEAPRGGAGAAARVAGGAAVPGRRERRLRPLGGSAGPRRRHGAGAPGGAVGLQRGQASRPRRSTAAEKAAPPEPRPDADAARSQERAAFIWVSARRAAAPPRRS